MPAAKPNVFNIPASAPFLRTLIEALRNGTLVPGFPAGADPLELARATLYLPTRRACRLARDVFLDVLGRDAVLLPRIVALGDLDEDEYIFADAATGDLAVSALTLAPAIEPLERRLMLAELIIKWANSAALRGAEGSPLIANSPAAALGLADDLARLIDDMTTRQIEWSKLDRLVPDALDVYWQRSLEFLKIAREFWPARLNELNAIDVAARRDALIDAEAERLKNSDAPVIAAGSTGSMPATAKLLAAIARLPHGAVMLPGLDTDLDEASWQRIAGDGKGGTKNETHDGLPAAPHPQFAMHGLLAQLGIARGDVKPLAQARGRELIVSEALRPAATTENWQQRTTTKDFATAADRSMAEIAVIEAANAEEEALAIAVALRETLETPGKSAALVTPDRQLARRVVAALARWHVDVEDSAGAPLADTGAGVVARLAAEAALHGLEPVTLLALLKHPILRLGAAKDTHARAVAALESAVLRGPRPRAGSAGLAHALTAFRDGRDKLHASDPRRLIPAYDLDAAQALVGTLAKALAPLETLAASEHNLAALADRHREVVTASSTEPDGTIVAFAGQEGLSLERAFADFTASPSARGLALAKRDYAETFVAAIASRAVRRPESEARIHVFGLLEARLQHVDRIVLGGLNENTWPAETRNDPWLSRPMRAALGLDPPERRIGLAAHDFAQALGAQEVILARAAKVAGAPAVISRFAQRLSAVVGLERWQQAKKRGERYLAYARTLDEPDAVNPFARPEPKVPAEARPEKLSVTAIEDWLRDPYTIYAKYVLKLAPLEAVDTPPGARDRGTLIHSAIGDFTKQYESALPRDAERELIAFGEKSFAPLRDFPEARAFWWPRFLRIARWFAGWERQRRLGLASVHGEIQGELVIPLTGASFTLTARADRIERRKDGSYAILDYKTGEPPTTPQVQSGLAPQLTLEAAILRHGKFGDLPPGSVAQVSYVRLRGGEPPAEQKDIKFEKGTTTDDNAEHALKRLTGIAARFLVDGEPYRSLVHPMWKKQYGDYDHLARVKEWAASGGESEYEGRE